MDYKDLTPLQKNLFNKIEGYFMLETYAEVKDIVTVLGVLINKWKRGLEDNIKRQRKE